MEETHKKKRKYNGSNRIGKLRGPYKNYNNSENRFGRQRKPYGPRNGTEIIYDRFFPFFMFFSSFLQLL